MGPTLIISDKHGRIYDLPALEACGMKGGEHFRLDSSSLIKLPEDSELFMLPERVPVGFDPRNGRFTEVKDSYAVAAFVAPGHTSLFSPSYKEKKGSSRLPLFSYTAAAFYKGEVYVPAVCVDRERRQRLRWMDIDLIKKNVRLFRKIFPKNRLVRHLERCALVYGCPAAKNFFLKRYEAPLPTSPACNARCIGCISYQPEKSCPVTQPRIKFIPKPEEVAEAAVFHLKEVADPVVSFGQGCEGEPLMVADVLERSIRLIRKETGRGVINLNTNASVPGAVRALFDAGLDSIRVSMNSVREPYYSRYYKQRSYGLADVLRSIEYAKKAGGFVSVNYLVMPGFTDSGKEAASFLGLLGKKRIDMVQWRNLNYDPAAYFREMKITVDRRDMLGMDVLIDNAEKKYPDVMKGYFNPSKGRIRRHKRIHGVSK